MVEAVGDTGCESGVAEDLFWEVLVRDGRYLKAGFGSRARGVEGWGDGMGERKVKAMSGKRRTFTPVEAIVL